MALKKKKRASSTSVKRVNYRKLSRAPFDNRAKKRSRYVPVADRPRRIEQYVRPIKISLRSTRRTDEIVFTPESRIARYNTRVELVSAVAVLMIGCEHHTVTAWREFIAQARAWQTARTRTAQNRIFGRHYSFSGRSESPVWRMVDNGDGAPWVDQIERLCDFIDEYFVI